MCDARPGPAESSGAEEQAEMTTWRDRRLDRAVRAADKARRGKQLLGRNDLIVPRGQQKQGCTHVGKIDPAAQRDEPPLRDFFLSR